MCLSLSAKQRRNEFRPQGVKLQFPPGPPNGWLGLRHLAAMRRDLVGFGAELQSRYGDVVYFRLGPLHCYQLTHPSDISEVLIRQARKFRKPARLAQVFGRFEGNGLVVSEGELWSRQRRLVQPAFQPARLPAYAETIVANTNRMLATWHPGARLDLAAAMRRLALNVVAQTLLSTSVEDFLDELSDAALAVQEWSMRELNRIWATPRWLPLLGQPRARRAMAAIDQVVWRLIRERRDSGIQRDDLLGRLLIAADRENNSEPMSDRQLRDELVTLLLAGHETEAAALTWTGWLLAVHPEVQERIAGDVRGALDDRPPEFADLPRLAPVDQALKEAMRLYPPIYFLSREAAEPVEIAGYEIRPGSQVFLQVCLTHRDGRWFDEPERFDPTRFTPENEPRIPPCAWFPFGAGPRACVGRSLAMLEGTLVLAAILQRYRLEVAPEERKPALQWQLSLHPKDGLWLVVQSRCS